MPSFTTSTTGEFGGTGFYRHRPTGFENITAERKQAYFDSAQEYIDTHGNPERKYITDSTDHFELFHKIDYRAQSPRDLSVDGTAFGPY